MVSFELVKKVLFTNRLNTLVWGSLASLMDLKNLRFFIRLIRFFLWVLKIESWKLTAAKVLRLKFDCAANYKF